MNTPLFQQKAFSETAKAREARERRVALATNLGKKLNTGCCGGKCPTPTQNEQGENKNTPIGNQQ